MDDDEIGRRGGRRGGDFEGVFGGHRLRRREFDGKDDDERVGVGMGIFGVMSHGLLRAPE